jgi:hypothetical protein
MHNRLDTFISRLIHHVRIRDGATDPMWAMLEAVEAAQKDLEEIDEKADDIEQAAEEETYRQDRLWE